MHSKRVLYIGSSLVSALLLSSACAPAPADQSAQLPAVPPPIVTPSGVPAPPPAPFVAFADTIQGVVVPDPLRWLEDTAAANTRAWMKSQAAYTDAVLARLVVRDSIAAELERTYASMPTLGDVAHTPSRTFLTRYLSDSPSLMALDSGQTAEREVISASALERLHPGSRIRTFVPSWDGRLVALGITAQGDGNAAIVIVDGTSGRVLPDGVPDLLTTTSGTRYEVTWLPDGSGFFYPRLSPSAGGGPAERLSRGRQFLHRMGTPQSADIPVFGFGVSPSIPLDKVDLPTRVGTSATSQWMFGSVFRTRQNGTDHYAAPLVKDNAAPAWVRISAVTDRIGSLALRGDTVYALARQNADRGKLVRLVLHAGAASPSPWEDVVPERKGVITGYVVQDDGIYFTEREAGAISLLRLAPGARDPVKISLPGTGAVNLSRAQSGTGVALSEESWASPPHWLFVSGSSVQALGVDDGYSAATAADLISELTEARSKDGTMVPVSVVYGKQALRNGHLDGTAPLLIDAYGGFGVSSDPVLNPLVQYFVSLGGIYAYAHVRGGGELGDAWHLAATRERKQNTIDDMIGAIEHLIVKRYTSAKRVSIIGRSLGAIIPGMVAMQRPDLLGAVLYEVGQPDEIRGAGTDPTSARNIAEIGDMDTPEGIRLLMKSSVYHQVPDTLALPAMIVHSAAGDYNFSTEMLVAKYVARLQKANTGASPVLWVQTPGGHMPLFAVSPQWAAAALSFIFWHTGDPRYQPAK